MHGTFHVPETIAFGAGTSQTLPEHLNRLGLSKVLIVSDPLFFENGLAQTFAELLKRAGIASAHFSDIQPDPTDTNVRAGHAALMASGAEGVVALGGGSALDAAKVIAVLATNPEPLSQYAGYHNVPDPGLPLIAIPTTAGTGSEVTRVAVITNTARDVKMMMLDLHLMPKVALVDSELSMSMPQALTAHVGVDTLTHAIEAYVSRKASAMTDPIALSAIKLVADNLETAWTEPDNREARAAMALAACQGGIAFSNSSVCLVHGMSRPLGAVFHIPHGLSNALLLPAVTRFSLSGAEARYATIARIMGLATSKDGDALATEKLVGGLTALNARLGVPSLQGCRGVAEKRLEEVLEKMAHDALASGSPQNNPVIPDVEAITGLYRAAW